MFMATALWEYNALCFGMMLPWSLEIHSSPVQDEFLFLRINTVERKSF
jgi:hypothetical protein